MELAKSSAQRTEAALARLVVAELQRMGFETYEEVEAREGRADIVGRRGPVVLVAEVKQSLSLVLMNQVNRWRGAAHYVIGVVGRGRTDGAALDWFTLRGLGLWECDHYGEGTVFVRAQPGLMRRADTTWIQQACIDETRSGSPFAAAGSVAGGYYTPFRRTALALVALVTDRPGLTIREAVAALKASASGHHYSNDKTARSSLPALIRRGVIAGIRLDETTLQLFPSTGDPSHD
jgi:hypothetical protein